MMAAELPTRILSYPDPRLRQVCAPVAKFDDRLADLVERLIELMQSGNGVGLAAPQTGVARRIFVCNPTGQPEDTRVFINPAVLDLTGQVEAEEGCLSLPDIHVMMHRARRCRVRACDVTGQPFELEVEGLLARICQHETDHLDGKLIIDRMDATDRIANRKMIAELEADFARTAKRDKQKRMKV